MGTPTQWEKNVVGFGQCVSFGGLYINLSETRQICGMIFLQQHLVA